jgi:hypothetical protein
MPSFKQFLVEATFSFDTKDISTDGKAKNRLAIARALGFDKKLPQMQAFFKPASVTSFISTFNAFVDAFPAETGLIEKSRPDGTGPGEFTAYFIFNNIGVGGKNAPIDLYLDGKEWAEAKAGAPIGDDTLSNFKITKDSAEAVTQIMQDLKDFNDKYAQITGEDLPDWRSASELKTDTLRDWADINLKDLAKDNKDGSKKPIDLILKKDGDLLQKGDEEALLNVKKDKSTAPLKALISGGKVVVDDRLESLETIVKAWAEKAHEEYVDGKRFVLFASKSGKLPRCRFVGNITADMIGLYNTHRQQPWAEVYLKPKSSGKSGKKP